MSPSIHLLSIEVGPLEIDEEDVNRPLLINPHQYSQSPACEGGGKNSIESVVDPVGCLSKLRKQQGSINLKFESNEDCAATPEEQPKHNLTPGVKEVKCCLESICRRECWAKGFPWIPVAEIAHSTSPEDQDQHE